MPFKKPNTQLIHRLLVVATLVFAVFLNSVSAQEVRQIDVKEGVADWVMHEPSGRVFATTIGGNSVIEFDSSPKEVRRFSVGVSPGELVIKGDLLIVGCTKSPMLQVIDLVTNETKGSISLNGTGPQALFCSAVDNGYVYCVCNTGDAWWDGEVFQCDLKTMKIRKRVKVMGWGQSHVVHVAMSRDGKWIVPDARGASSPSGADLMKVDEEELTFTQIRDYHDSFGEIVADPSNRFWTFGPALYSLDITKKLRTFEGTPLAIHPKLDMVVSLKGFGLTIERFSDASLIGQIGFDSSSKTADRALPPSAGRSLFDPTVRIDAKHQLAFVGTRYQGLWADLKEYAKETDELRMMLAPSEVKTIVGVELRVPIEKTGPKSETELVLASGPSNAKIENGNLVWHPKSDQLGPTSIQLELKSTKSQKVVDSIEVMVEVSSPSVKLEFMPRAMELSSGGKYMVVWGPSPGQEDRHPAHTGADDIAVIDIEKREIIAKKSMQQGIRSATIDDANVFVTPTSGNLVYRLDHKLEGSQRIFTQSTPVQLVRIGKNQLLVVSDSPQLFDTTTLKPIDKKTSGLNMSGSHSIAVGKDVVQIENVIIELKTGDIIGTKGFANLPPVVTVPNQNNRFASIQPGSSHRWGRRLEQNSLLTSDGSRITVWQGNKYVALSDRWPLAVMIERFTDSSPKTIDFADLHEGTIVHSATISAGAPPKNGIMAFTGVLNPLIVRDDKVFCLARDRVLILSIPKEIVDDLPVPTHFGNHKIEVIEAAKPAKIKPVVIGPQKDISFSLLTEFEGLSIDSATGELSIDTPFLWKNFAENFVKIRNTRTGLQFPTSQDPLAERTENSLQYKLITGQDLPNDMYAAQLPISISLQSDDGQRDMINISVVIRGDNRSIEKAVSGQKALQAKQMAAAKETREKMQLEMQNKQRQERAQPNQVQLPQGGEVNDRIDALENRMRRIEAALDSILKRLDANKNE